MAPQADIHEEVTLQAVILAECEQDYGAPVTQDVPKVTYCKGQEVKRGSGHGKWVK